MNFSKDIDTIVVTFANGVYSVNIRPTLLNVRAIRKTSDASHKGSQFLGLLEGEIGNIIAIHTDGMEGSVAWCRVQSNTKIVDVRSNDLEMI